MPHLIRRAAVLIAAACGLAVFVTVPAPAGAQSPPGELEPGQVWSGDLYSPSGDFQLWIGGGDATEFQLVNKQDSYQVEYVNAWEAIVPPPLIPSGTEHLVMQYDGNLVLYNPDGRAVWATYTFGRGNYFRVQDDGNLVVYNSAGRAVWASGSGPAALGPGQTLTAGHNLHLLNRPGGTLSNFVMQTDGNLVLYYGGHAVWATYTFGAGNRLVMQTDGNLVLYSASNKALWNTRTATGKPSYLEIYAPPALIVSLINGGPVWRWN